MDRSRDSCLSVNFNPSLHCTGTVENCYNVLTSPDSVHIGPAKSCNSLEFQRLRRPGAVVMYIQGSYGQGKSGNFEGVRENREGQGKVREF